jgi:hypothetical protein
MRRNWFVAVFSAFSAGYLCCGGQEAMLLWRLLVAKNSKIGINSSQASSSNRKIPVKISLSLRSQFFTEKLGKSPVLLGRL